MNQPGSRLRALALIGLLALGLGCGLAGWRLTSAPAERWLVAGASDLRVASDGFSRQQISYTAPGQPYAWYFELLRRLAHDQWQAPVDTRTRIRVVPDVHWRLRQIGPIYIEEQIAIQGEPNRARIELRRRIIVPWRSWLGR